ncbi:MAG: 3-phosphoshikimate 1-carboxyvinyltransferase [Ferruginibacter sp.]
MKVSVSPSPIAGILPAPSSKSSMQRACAAALLHGGTTYIYNAGISNDDKAALSIIKCLGALVKIEESKITITSDGFSANSKPKEDELSCGESGLSFRMFAPIAALSGQPISLTGTGSLLKRPMNFFDEVFPQLHVQIESKNGYLPLLIKGPLRPASIHIDGSLSSQFLTGLLFAFAAAATKTETILVNELKSKPYIDLTLDVMRKFGYNITHQNYECFTICPPSLQTATIEYTVEGDWSSASFLLVAGAIAGSVTVSGLDEESAQADRAIMIALESCGANINKSEDSIEIRKSILSAFTFDATDCPDLFPPLAALASYCEGISIITGTHRLAAKESNRAETLQQIFGTMGIDILLVNDEMHITGGKVNAASVSSHHDHRIAMTAAIAALGASGPMEISNADAINKSYPQFYSDMKKLGTIITTIQE